MTDAQPPRRTGGRPRSEQIDTALLNATWEILESAGYVGLSLEAVARRAGTSRPALYRRWSGRAPLAIAAIARHLEAPVPPDTGCTLCDIGESFTVFLAAYRGIRPDALSALYADCAADPALHAQYLATIIEPARSAVAGTLDRAIARGDLRPDIDRELLLDLVASLVHYRAVFGDAHLSEAEADRAVELLLRGAAADFGELLAHSEELDSERSTSSRRHDHDAHG